MVRPRTGIGRLGCLVTLLVLAAALHFGLGIAEAYWRYYRYRDAMVQTARFGKTRPDAHIKRDLSLVADSIGLPPEAHDISITRRDSLLIIEARYSEMVELPGTVREIKFHPRVERR